MSDSFLSIKVLGSSRYKVDLVEGVTRTNFLSICYAALTTIGLLTFISYATTYVVVENLNYQRDQIGTIVGDLQVVAEIVLLLVFLMPSVWLQWHWLIFSIHWQRVSKI